MKNSILISLFFVIPCLLFSHNNFDAIHDFGTYQENGVLVERNGFIDKDSNEVHVPQYDEINQFGEYRKDWALVKANGRLGFIDEDGNEVAVSQYSNIIIDDDDGIKKLKNGQRTKINKL